MQGRRFEFEACLGRGSFGEVYRAKMSRAGGLSSLVAVKLLRPEVDLSGQAVERLRDEGRVLAQLSHPSILKVVDLVTLDGRIALVTELVDGADLSVAMGQMPVRALLESLAQIAAALDQAFRQEGPTGPIHLVHRDVKPSNIRVGSHGQAKLLDFGIARFDASDREVRTASDLVVGSVPYMAPERFIHKEVHPASDVFSLGCCLYEAVSGRRFYGALRVAGISRLAMRPETYDDFLDERLKGVDLDAGVERLLRRMVALGPSDRPVAADVAMRLDELADEVGGLSLRMWCQQHPWADPRPLPGALVGKTIDERPLDGVSDTDPIDLLDQPRLQRAPVVTVQAEVDPDQVSTVQAVKTFEFQSDEALPLVPSESSLSGVPLPPVRRRSWVLWGGLVGLVVALILVVLGGLTMAGVIGAWTVYG